MITKSNDKDKSVCIESTVSRERVKKMAQIILRWKSGIKRSSNATYRWQRE